jgi:uncharacterized protein YjbI with pentapeptide repeats
LANADLSGANLSGANLTEADLSNEAFHLQKQKSSSQLSAEWYARKTFGASNWYETQYANSQKDLERMRPNLTGATMPDGSIHD